MDTDHDVPREGVAAMSSLVSEEYDFVIGVDTHAATHTFTVVAGSTGTVLSHAIFPTSPAGLERATGWLVRRCGDARAWIVVEGTGSFGAILTERIVSSIRQTLRHGRQSLAGLLTLPLGIVLASRPTRPGSNLAYRPGRMPTRVRRDLEPLEWRNGTTRTLVTCGSSRSCPRRPRSCANSA